MRLFAHPMCPYAQRALLAKDLKGVSDDQLRTIIIDFESPPDDMVAINPDWTVPILELSKGKGFDDSLLIMEYIDTLPSQAPRLYGNSPEEIALTKFRIHKMLVYVLRPLKLATYSAFSPLNQAEQESAALSAWQQLSVMLEKTTGPYFGGSTLNALDLAVATFFRKAEGAHAFDGKLTLPAETSPAGEYLMALRNHSSVARICGTTEAIATSMAPFRGEKPKQTVHWSNYLPPPFD